MPRRSTRVTLSNNTPYTLQLTDPNMATQDPTHGNWTDLWRPPTQIPPKTHGQWQSESAGIGTGTEGSLSYEIVNTGVFVPPADPMHPFPQDQPCSHEVVNIHWDNPFVWQNTIPIDYTVTGHDLRSQTCCHELFPAGLKEGGSMLGETWADYLFNWPAVLGLILLTDDINLEFTLGLRQLGSVDGTIFSFYDGSKGLRALANTVGQSSLRKLLHL
jgi:hypothetical protein